MIYFFFIWKGMDCGVVVCIGGVVVGCICCIIFSCFFCFLICFFIFVIILLIWMLFSGVGFFVILEIVGGNGILFFFKVLNWFCFCLFFRLFIFVLLFFVLFLNIFLSVCFFVWEFFLEFEVLLFFNWDILLNKLFINWGVKLFRSDESFLWDEFLFKLFFM